MAGGVNCPWQLTGYFSCCKLMNDASIEYRKSILAVISLVADKECQLKANNDQENSAEYTLFFRCVEFLSLKAKEENLGPEERGG